MVKQKFICTVEAGDAGEKEGTVNVKFEWEPKLDLKKKSNNNLSVLSVGFAIADAVSNLKKSSQCR